MKRLLFILLCLLFVPSWLWAGNSRLAQLEAAYLLNFIKYTTWEKQEENQVLQVYVFAPEVYKVLNRVRQNKNSKPMVLHEIRKDKISFAAADVIFISKEMDKYVSDKVWNEIKSSTLVIADYPKVIKSGGFVELYVVDDKLRFHINIVNLIGTRINSNLLHMATQVVQRNINSVENNE